MESKLGKVGWWDWLIHLTCTRGETDSIRPCIHASISCCCCWCCCASSFVRAQPTIQICWEATIENILSHALQGRKEGKLVVVFFLRSVLFFSLSFNRKNQKRAQRNTLKPQMKNKNHTHTPTKCPPPTQQFDCDEDTTMNKVTLLSGYLRKRNVKGGTLSLKQRFSALFFPFFFWGRCVIPPPSCMTCMHIRWVVLERCELSSKATEGTAQVEWCSWLVLLFLVVYCSSFSIGLQYQSTMEILCSVSNVFVGSRFVLSAACSASFLMVSSRAIERQPFVPFATQHHHTTPHHTTPHLLCSALVCMSSWQHNSSRALQLF